MHRVLGRKGLGQHQDNLPRLAMHGPNLKVCAYDLPIENPPDISVYQRGGANNGVTTIMKFTKD